MRKGELTHQTILERAVRLASRVGLEGLSIGGLAEELNLSKSGLFAHFKSKAVLQVQVLETATALFTERVIRPALTKPRGEPRVRALFEGWLAWDKDQLLEGGCIFVAASVELDDSPGPARDKLVQTQRDWLDVLAQAARIAVAEGHFREDVDVEQFAHDEYAVMLGFHHAKRLMRDPQAETRARRAFEALLAAARAPAH
ncbi:TetR/AcrR family transcriptional regulator [Myxococcus sp. RHSTA-1-4]|uniref:TetR/AcrR family transcriptional regulator n=1 Tax=Myxococcus sp. RHSTA-1-4 TaxID=2874601 RepID=UPI001CC0D79E|nr:TetR/AcrR family transcriptional regulator [Myxococcus sp. RHSTA-1-4]MBZ4419687.1 TetR/AcrR family transcriptional regulator [Myxococcus sp. RHSTA-1-4]